MDSITHFSHEHPLHLLKQISEDERKFECHGCRKPLVSEEKHGDVYGCELCESFFLHKSCAQLPMEIMHKFHQHSLFLLSKLPTFHSSRRCDYCLENIHLSFFYHCYLCNFTLCINCDSREKDSVVSCNKDLTFYHPSHKHQLMVLPRPASLLCDACEVKDTDLSLYCSSCHYWIHKRCAMLPTTTLFDIHSHSLTLAFGLPTQYHKFPFCCYICARSLCGTQTDWLYYCDMCRYFFHIRCMGTKKRQIEFDWKGVYGLLIKDHHHKPHLPMSDKSVELIQRFLRKNNSLAPNIEQGGVTMFSHKHPLVYSNDQILEDDEEILCDACIEPIFSPPYYHCAECRYFLHLTCANLPQEIQYQSHPHQLVLAKKTIFDKSIPCYCCDRHTNGFFFYCPTEGCEFSIDLKCAALPQFLGHQSHDHPLLQTTPLEFDYSCKGCKYHIKIGDTCFACENCNFYLHVECLLLAKTMKHRFDSKHPLVLKFPPHAYHPESFDCYQCEMEIDPNEWLYHCEECDLSLHLECTNIAWRYYNVKFGQKIEIGCHPHPLKYVYEPSVRSSKCAHCEEFVQGFSKFSLECETCNFRLCMPCYRKSELLLDETRVRITQAQSQIIHDIYIL